MMKECSKCKGEFNSKSTMYYKYELCPTCYRIYELGQPDVIILDEIEAEAEGRKFKRKPKEQEEEVLTGVPPVFN